MKYQRSTKSDCKDIGNSKSECVGKTLFLCIKGISILWMNVSKGEKSSKL